MANQKYGAITQYFPDKTSADDIDQEREYTMVYHVPGMSEEKSLVELSFFKLKFRTKTSYTTEHVDKSCPRLFALTKETSLMDVKRLMVERLRGIFEKLPEDDEQLNKLVSLHVKDNLPMVTKGKYTRTRAECEFCNKKHGYKDDYCDLKIDGEMANASVETASAVTIGKILSMMEHERHLILAVEINSNFNIIDFNELRCKYRRFGDDDEDDTIAGRSGKGLTLANCFEGYSNEEVLSGDDQWYCNLCKEHRDITKKLEIFSTPQIFII